MRRLIVVHVNQTMNRVVLVLLATVALAACGAVSTKSDAAVQPDAATGDASTECVLGTAKLDYCAL